MAEVTDLRSLRETPFELLRELERRSLSSGAAGAAVSGQGDWVGIGIRVGESLMLVPREEVREVLEYPDITRVPGAQGWVCGITNVRGRLMPAVDVSAFIGGDPIRAKRSARMIIVNRPQIPAGLLVDEVLGFRRFASDEFRAEAEHPGLAGARDLVLGCYERGQEIWPVLSFVRLIESARFDEAAA